MSGSVSAGACDSCVLQDLTLGYKSVTCCLVIGHYGAFLQEEWDLLQRMSKSLERLHFEREWDELVIEKRFRALRGREVQHVSLRGGGDCIWVFSLSYCIPVAPSKILGGISLQTHARSAKILQYLKQTLGESVSIKSKSNGGLVPFQI